MHCENGIYAARKGWDILIEKPVTASLEQAKELSQVIQESGIASLVGHHRRYHPSVQALKSLVTGKKIGIAVTASMIWAMRKPDAYFEQNWRSTEGSPVMINIVHDLDLLRFIFGDIVNRMKVLRPDVLDYSAEMYLKEARSGGGGHPLINTVLGKWIDHMKGDRKVTGKSKASDIMVNRTERYWSN